MADHDHKREVDRERRARYRNGKVNVAFATTPEIRDKLRDMAADYGYSSLKEFFEALAENYVEPNRK